MTAAFHANPSSPESSQAGSPPGESRGVGESRPPETLEEAADKFEKVLVRQFVKVMTKDMFSGSLAGEGGGNWMKTQRDRQRGFVNDMVADRLAEADTLEVSKTLAREWGIETTSSNSSSSPTSLESRPSAPNDLESRPSAPNETVPPSKIPADPPSTTPDQSHIDHAV